MKKKLLAVLWTLLFLIPGVFSQTPAYVQTFNNYFNSNLYKYNSEGLVAIIGCPQGNLYTYSAGSLNANSQVAVASISKWVTSAIIMMLVEENKFALDDKVSQYISSWGGGDKQNITIRQLLAHTSGVQVNTGYDDASQYTLAQAVDLIAGTPLLFTPGTDFEYGTAAYKVASRVAEIREGKLWKDIFAERLKSVGGMPNADFNPLWINNPSTGAGLSVSLNEYANFLRMILRHGMHNSTRIMDSVSVVAMEAESAQDGGPIVTYGLGVWREQVNSSGVAKELMHPGATGTLAWVDRNKGYFGIILSSSGFENVNPTNQAFRELARNNISNTECGSGTPPSSCDFNITANNSVSGSNLNLGSSCAGTNCSGVSYSWSGPGASGSGSSLSITKPTTPGTYTYTVTASRNNCSNKTATTTYTVPGGGNPCGYVDKQTVGTWSGLNVQTRQYTVNGASTWLIVTAINGSSTDKHFPRGKNFADRGDISWSNGVINKTCLGGGETGYGGLVIPSGITVPSGYSQGTEPDGAIYFHQTGGGCSTPSAPSLSASPATITTSGGSSTLSATGCSGGTITWSNGLGTGTSKIVAPSSTTTYTATCTVSGGCVSSAASVTVTVNISGGSSSYSQCKESESSTGNGTVTGDPNASNGNTRGEENNNNHYVEYALTGVPSAGTYYVTLRYYSSSAPTVGVQVNSGGTQTINLANSGSWNIVWTTHQFSVNLNAGNNTIRISGTGGGSCRQDRICVSNTSGSPAVLGSDPAEINTAKLLSVAPNPSNGAFQTDFYLEKGKRATIIISDLQGRIIYRQQVIGQGQHREKINLLNKASGTLLLQIQKEYGTEVKKINIAR